MENEIFHVTKRSFRLSKLRYPVKNPLVSCGCFVERRAIECKKAKIPLTNAPDMSLWREFRSNRWKSSYFPPQASVENSVDLPFFHRSIPRFSVDILFRRPRKLRKKDAEDGIFVGSSKRSLWNVWIFSGFSTRFSTGCGKFSDLSRDMLGRCGEAVGKGGVFNNPCYR